MRNLALVGDAWALVPAGAAPPSAPASPQSTPPLLLAVNPSRNERFVLTGHDGSLTVVDDAGRVRSHHPALLAGQAAGGATWLHLTFLVDGEVLFAAASDGAMVLIHGAASGAAVAQGAAPTPPPRVELLGSIDGGLVAVAWAADQSRVLLVAGTHTLLVLTPQAWDVLAEATTSPFATAPVTDGSGDDGAVYAAWRHDAKWVALSVFDPATGRRALRIYAGDLTQPPSPVGAGAAAAIAPAGGAGAVGFVRGRNEDGTPVTGLHGPLAWSPDGSLLGCGQLVPARKRLQVALFEPNGLRHREVPLAALEAPAIGAGAAPSPPAWPRVSWVGWNADGDVLAVATTAPGAPGPSLQLWHRDNYHWYCKRTLATGASTDASLPAPVLGAAQWDPEKGHRLHLLATASSASEQQQQQQQQQQLVLRCVDSAWEYSHSSVADECAASSGVSVEGSGAAARVAGGVTAVVAEGGRVQLTPHGLASVPPPMAYTTLTLQSPQQQPAPNDVAFNSGARARVLPAAAAATPSCDVAALTAAGDIAFAAVAFVPPRQAPPPNASAIPLPGVAAAPAQSATGFACGLPSDMGAAAVAAQGCVALGGASARVLSWPPSTSVDVDPASAVAPVTVAGWSLRQLVWGAVAAGSEAVGAPALVAAAIAGIVGNGSSWIAHDHVVIGCAPTASAATAPTSLPLVDAVALPVPAGASVVRIVPAPLAAADGSANGDSLGVGVALSTGALYVLRVTVTAAAADGRPRLRLETVCKPSTVDSAGAADDNGDDAVGHAQTAAGRPFCTFPEPPTWVRLLRVGQVDDGGDDGTVPLPPRLLPLGHTRSARLYAGGASMLSPAAAPLGVGWHAPHGTLMLVTLGPAPSLVYCSGADLCAVADGRLSLWDVPTFARRGAVAVTANLQPTGGGGGGGDGGDGDAAAAGVGGGASAGLDAVWLRPLERGARLVAVDGATDGVLLQMSRGNCETIVPRALTLATVRRCLDAAPVPAMGAALELCRRHRVDLNVLYDHDPSAWATHAWALAAVRDVAAAAAARAAAGVSGGGGAVSKGGAGSTAVGCDRWDLYLAGLDDADCCDAASGKYAPPHWYRRPRRSLARRSSGNAALDGVPPAVLAADPSLARILGAPGSGSSGGADKVNRACATLRAALLHAMLDGDGSGAVRWRHPLVLSAITSFARQVPADLTGCLAVVLRVAAEEQLQQQTSVAAAPLPGGLPPVSGDAALSHALLVCDSDAELLFTCAVGMYDLPLAAALVQRGQGDPREYGPLLGELAAAAAARPDDPPAPVRLPWEPPSGSPQALTAGELRLRVSVDAHLARWSRVVEWLLALAAATGELHLPLAGGRGGSGVPATTRALLELAAASVDGSGGAAAAPSEHVSTPLTSDAAVAAALAMPPPASQADLIAEALGRVRQPASALATGDGGGSAATIVSPARVALSLIGTHGLYSRAAELLAAIAAAAPAPSPAAPTSRRGGTAGDSSGSTVATAALRHVTIRHAWHVALGSPQHTAPSTAGGSAQRNSAPPPLSLVERLVHLLTTGGGGGNGQGASVHALSIAPAPATAQALELLLLRCSPPAVDDALALAAACGGGDVEAAFNGVPLWRLALTLASNPLSCVRRGKWPAHVAGAADGDGGSTQAPPSPPSLPQLAADLAAALAAGGGGGGTGLSAGTRLAAAASLHLEWLRDPDEGVQLLCDGWRWVDASCAAASAGRLDLVDTVVAPSLAASAASTAAALAGRLDDIADVVRRLNACRALRAAAPLRDLTDLATPGAWADGGGDGGGGDDSASAWGGGGDGASSVWSDAQSVFSAGWQSGAGGGSTTSSSAASSSSAYSKSSGRFSHLPQTSLPTLLAPQGQSLRLAASQPSAVARAASDQAVATSFLNRRDRVAAARAAGQSDQQRGWGKRDKRGVHRPGSAGEEADLERELTGLWPGPGSPLVEEVAAVRAAATALAQPAAGREAAAALAALVAGLRGLQPAPAPRRDVPAEVAATTGAPVDAVRAHASFAPVYGPGSAWPDGRWESLLARLPPH